MWSDLISSGGPTGVRAPLLREIGIYGGAQGIWVDKSRTAAASATGSGVTVGLLHTGDSYDDDLADDGIIYHYPNTSRQGNRDAAEVDATKETGRLNVPVFVVTCPYPKSRFRDVRKGWVEDWDDAERVFYVSFGDEPTAPFAHENLDEEFNLVSDAKTRKAASTVRPGQQRFKFNVLKRYGGQCAVCNVSLGEVLDAAHIRPKQKKGSDDPRNGLVLCATHHRAFDAGLFCIEPNSLELRYSRGVSPRKLKIPRPTLSHMSALPHKQALTWRWSEWRKRRGPKK